MTRKTPTTTPPHAPNATEIDDMNAPIKTPAIAPLLATVAATLAAVVSRRGTSDPASLHVPTPKGVAGVLVLFGAPTSKPSPAVLRTAFDDSLGRAGCGSAKDTAPATFLATLPDVVTPVAALGLAVRGAVDEGARWVHNRTSEKHSKWTYCAANISDDSVSIQGMRTCAEAYPDGRLVVDSAVPAHIASTLTDEYAKARGVVEPSRISALVSAYLAKVAGGRSVASSAYLLPETSPLTCGVLAGLADLGGFAVTYAVSDPTQIENLTAPVVKSIEEQIADVVKSTSKFIENATAVSAPGSTSSIQERSGETVRANILAARKAAALWRDRLNLASLDVDAALDRLDVEADKADEAALAVMAKRREDAKLRKEVAGVTASRAVATLPDETACGFKMGRTGPSMDTPVTCCLPVGHKGPHDDGEGFRVDDNGRVIPLPGAIVRTFDQNGTVTPDVLAVAVADATKAAKRSGRKTGGAK